MNPIDTPYTPGAGTQFMNGRTEGLSALANGGLRKSGHAPVAA
ncbi:hypothetical protein [Oceanospirillum beijerinckii]|nr:hypothetical protein [Oceanospirillum beijerinckii]